MTETASHIELDEADAPWKLVGLIVDLDRGKKKREGHPEESERKEQMARVSTPEGQRDVPLSEAVAKCGPSCFEPDPTLMHALERWAREYKLEQQEEAGQKPAGEPKPPVALDVSDRQAFRRWLEANHATEPECWIAVKRGRPRDDGAFYYLDAVEEALCFGWIDSVQKAIDGATLQRFSPRKPGSSWTELNKERVRRLEKLGLMTDVGREALPPMGPRSFRIDPDIEHALKQVRCWKKFKSFPPLYQRVRASNVASYKTRDPEAYDRMLSNLLSHTLRGELYGEWNDYGRLLDY